MLLMVEKGIRGGLCHSINRYAKTNNKYMENFDKNKDSSCLKYWDVNNLHGWAMSQKFHVNRFKLVQDLSEINDDFIKSYNEKAMKDIFLKLTFNIPKIYMKQIIFCVR